VTILNYFSGERDDGKKQNRVPAQADERSSV
jgi:hypothetical protein